MEFFKIEICLTVINETGILLRIIFVGYWDWIQLEDSTFIIIAELIKQVMKRILAA